MDQNNCNILFRSTVAQGHRALKSDHMQVMQKASEDSLGADMASFLT
jgi:hypothetical protein